MTIAQLPAAILVLAVLLGSLRWLRQPAQRRAPWRLALLLVLQAGAGALLYLGLHPPQRPAPAVEYALIGPGADADAIDAARVRGQRLLRLPEAPAVADAQPVVDLATALRRHPQLATAQLIGDGLPTRDRDIAGLALDYRAPALRGLVELQPPHAVAPGNRFAVGGRVQGIDDAQLVLLDPAGRVVDSTGADARGYFRLHGSARDAGRTLFQLRLHDAAQAPMETVPVPVQVVDAAAPRLWLLGSAPNPETKYLQRWAQDAGLSVHSQVGTGGGIVLGDAPRAVTAATLARTDLLLLDERSLAALGAGQRATLRQAIEQGLGVLVRLSAAPDAGARAALAQLGLPVRGNAQVRVISMESGKTDPQRLAALRGPRARAGNAETAPALERLQLDSADAATVPLLHDAAGNALGHWRALGQGRVGLLAVSDSFRLVLGGRDDLHATLWSEALATLARPRDDDAGTLQPLERAWAGERTVLCGVEDGATLAAPDNSLSTLRADPAAPGCAALWPALAGWQVRDDGSAFFVFDPSSAATLHRADTARATAALAQRATASPATAPGVPGRRWPWLLAFALVAGLLWWLERRRPANPV